MNFLSILKQLFPMPPTMDEFIASHNPTSVQEVEYLEKQYEYLMKAGVYPTGGDQNG